MLAPKAFVSSSEAHRAPWVRLAGPDLNGVQLEALQRGRKVVLALIFGLHLALLEAFGFQEDMFLYRLGFWTVMMVLWVVLFSLAQAGIRRQKVVRLSPVVRMLVALVIAVFPAALLAHRVVNGVFVGVEPELLKRALQVLLIGGAFELTCLAVFAALARMPQVVVDNTPPPLLPPLVERLPYALRGPVLCLQMEDHYVRIHTEKGSALILMRFSDAIAQLDPESGLRVHRSWWIATEALAGIEPLSRTVRARLSNGLMVPVSQPYVRELMRVAEAGGHLPRG